MSDVPEKGKDLARSAVEGKKQSTSTVSEHTTPPAINPTTPEPAVITKPSEWKTLDRLRVRIDPWVSIINLVIAILAFAVIVLQSLIYIQQKNIMNTQSELMEKSFRVSERAYVGVESVKADLENREILIMLQNIGHVPAPVVKLQGQHIRAIPKETEQGGAVFRWDAGAVELFPGTPMPVIVHLDNVEQSELDVIRSKTKILYIGGTIQYDDGFGHPQKTTFAFQYDPPPQNRWIAHSDLSKIFKDISGQ